jgi:choline monooxygenase
MQALHSDPLASLVKQYDRDAPIEEASTIPAGWYTDPRILDLERRTTFSRSWQLVARVDQVAAAGRYVSGHLAAGEPVAIVRDTAGILRGFFNVCRHHAAEVVTAPEGEAKSLRCPYHGWTYGLDGSLKGTPDFAGVCSFDRAEHGLVPLPVSVWEGWVFVRADAEGPSLADFLGATLVGQARALGLERFRWTARRVYSLACNWKVFVDNYLDGGYHVPHLHTGLDSVLDYSHYAIEVGERFCLQSSPLVSEGGDPATAAVRTGDRAAYYWIHPNLMINCYGSAMDTNLVIPRGVDRTDVVFDFYFDDVSEAARARNLASIEVSDRIQHEDVAICESVQRGLGSRAYSTGRLSVRREAGEHLFHRLLYDDLMSGLSP